MSRRRPVVLTERDYDILTLIGLVGYAAQNQIEREFFTSTDRCRKRTKALADAGLLRVTTIGSRQPYLFSLTTSGRRALGTVRPDLAERVRLVGAIALGGVAHHLGVVDARLYLAAVVARGHICSPLKHSDVRSPLLRRWSNAGNTHVRERGFGALGLEPDGVADVSFGADVITFAIEVDCAATESTRVIARKLRRYADAHADGLVDELWFLVKASPRRVATIRGLVTAHGLAANTRIFLPSEMISRPVRPPVPLVASGADTSAASARGSDSQARFRGLGPAESRSESSGVKDATPPSPGPLCGRSPGKADGEAPPLHAGLRGIEVRGGS